MAIQVVNFNLEGITHEEYMGAAKEVAPAFKELSGLRLRSGYQHSAFVGCFSIIRKALFFNKLLKIWVLIF